VSREALEESQALAINTAKGSLLEVAGNHSTEQVLAQTRRGRSSELQSPLPPKRIAAERTDARDRGLDRGRIWPAPPHGQALGWAVVSGSDAPVLPEAIR
jgi:hypothetical protein